MRRPASAEAQGATAAGADATWLPFTEEDRQLIEADTVGIPADVYAVSDFLTHEVERAEGERVKAADLFAAYRKRLGARVAEATNFRQFGRAVFEYGISRRRGKTGVSYLNIRLAVSSDQEAA